ncbi:MAG: SRPBCC family protein [Bryobacteraceae bacterium]|nr:SRPBCC family protein [Bryobacteraceae bacterium]
MEIEKQRDRIGGADRWASLVGGGALVAYGLTRNSRMGKAMALVGGSFIYRGVTGEGRLYEALKNRAKSLPYGKGIKIRRAVTVNKPAGELYEFWRNFGNLPRFMRHLEAVTPLSEGRSRWRVKGPAGRIVEWDAEIIADTPGEMIGWRSLPDAEVDNAGSVRFERAPGGRGTIVRVQLQYNPPGGRAGAFFAKLLGKNPDHQLHGDLMRFKQVMEAGEIPTTEGQPTGRGKRRRVEAPETSGGSMREFEHAREGAIS